MNLLDPHVIQALANAGGWVFAALVLALGMGGFFWAVTNGKISSGAILERSIGLQEATVPAINGLVASVQILTDLARDQARLLDELRRDIRELERGQRR